MANKLPPSINQSLVQTTFQNTSFEKTDQLQSNIQQVLSLQFQPKSHLYADDKTHFLDRFTIEGLIPHDFKLTELQEQTIVRLFQKWSLHDEICLIDLLGVDIHQGLNLMKNSLVEETQFEFSSCMFLLYLYLQRHKDCYPPLSEIFGEFHYGSKDSTSSGLENIKKQLRDAYRLKLAQIDANTKLSKETKSILKDKVTVQVGECVQSLELLIFLVNLKFGSSLLIDRCLVYLKGSNSLIKDHKSTLPHLKMYLNYANDVFSSSYRNKSNSLVGLNFNFLNLEISKKELPTLVDLCKHKIQFWDRIKDMVINDQKLVLNGLLTHSDWLKREGLKPVHQKDNLEFAEVLFKQVIILQTYNCLIKDAMRMIDDVIIPGVHENWTKQENIVIRFWVNLSMVEGDFAKSSEKCLIHQVIISRLTEVFDPLQASLIGIYKRHNHTDIAFSKDELEETVRKRANGSPASLVIRQHYTDQTVAPKKNHDPNTIDVISVADIPLPSQEEMEALMVAFNEKVKSLPQVLKSLRTEFVQLMSELPKEQRTQDFFKQCCFEECLKYCRIVFILNDYKALTDTLENLYNFPEELADFIELQGLDDIFKPVEAAPSISVVFKNLKVTEPKVEPKVETQEFKFEPKVETQEFKFEPKVETQESKFEPFAFKSKNVRKVIKQLTEAGFFLVRQKGSHQIFKRNEHGPQVVVPNHDELKTGTLASIQNQVNTALNINLDYGGITSKGL